MKKTIFTILASGAAAACAFGQAQFTWAPIAGTGGTVQFSTDGATATAFPTGNPSAVNGASAYAGQTLHVDFFAAAVGTTLVTGGPAGTPLFTTAWTDVAVSIGQIKINPGRQSAIISLPGNFAQGLDAQIEVVGWTGTATSWAAEVASPGGTLLGYGGELFNGASTGPLSWDQPMGSGSGATPTPPGSLTTGAAGYGGVNAAGLVLEPVPEPTTLALGGLGVASLLLFRRRK